MSEKVTFESLTQAFFKIEREENLYNWEVAGVQVWTLLRSKVLHQLADDAGIYDLANVKIHRAPADYVGYQGPKPTPILLKHVTGWRWFLRGVLPKTKDPKVRQWLAATELVVPFSTRTATGEEPLSQAMIDVLGERALVLGHGAWDHKSDRPHQKIMQNIARKKYKNYYAVLLRLVTKKSDRAKWNRVIKALEAAAGVKLSKHRQFPTWEINNYLCDARLFRKVFKRIRIKHLFIVNATSMTLMGALQEIGVPTIELQQGLISEHSLQFSWPGRPNIKYLPAEVWTWGGIWTEGIENAGNQTVRVVGSTPAFVEARERQDAGDPTLKRVPGRVVVMSQPVVSTELFAAAEQIAKKQPKLEVVFKPHPRDQIEQFKTSGLPKNLRMAKPEENSTVLCATSEYAIGVFSTTLIEALGFGAKVGILKLAGWESLKRLVDGGHAHGFDTVDELVAGIKDLPLPKDRNHFYAPKADLAAELAALEERTA